MAPEAVCIILFVVMTGMILIGVPLAVSMLVCGFVGFVIVSDISIAMSQFTNALFTLSHSYNFSVVPLFMMVGVLAAETGMANGTFVSARQWIGRRRGGLLHTVVLANMIFGACSGISVAGNMVFSRIALPELKKANYDETLSIGTITCAGSLSSLIPPSIAIITFCLLTDVSIGPALVVGLSTGILFAILMMLMIVVIGVVRPKLIPPGDVLHIPLKEKVKTLRLLLPILALFILIVGGCFFGWFPATTAGAVACVAILLYAFVRRTPLKLVLSSILVALKDFALLYLILVGGQFFSRFITLTGMARAISDGIAAINMPPYVVFLIVFVFYLFCGCFMDVMSIIIVTVPVVFPVLTALGFPPLALVIVLVFSLEIAALTPPIGFSVFAVARVTKLPVRQVFRGVLPFFGMDVALVLLVAAFPGIILWLPRLMGYAM